MKKLSALGHLNTTTFSAIQMMTFTLIPFIAEKATLSLSSVVLSFSVGSFLFLWSSPFWASRSDSWGRMKVLSVGMLGLFLSTGILTAVLMAPGTYWMNELAVWGSRLLYGLTAAAIVPVSQALQIDQHPEQTPLKSMLSNSMSLNVGRALGPLYLLLGGGSNMLLILQSTVVWALVVLGLNLFGITQSEAPKATQTERISILEWKSALRHISDIFSLAILFTSFVGILNFSLASILKKSFDLTSVDSSVLMAKLLLVSAILAVLTQALGKVLFKNPWQGAMIVGVATLLGASLILGDLGGWAQLWLAIVLLSVGLSLIPPCYMALMATRGPELQFGRRAGLAAAANTLGYTFGGGLAALTFKLDLFGIESVMTALVVVMALNIALLYRRREAVYA
ncbi:MFS transporter [Bdellovibrio bacteriovorus]|uniref:Multidrug resistance protein n=1 Tax=Bdellovibrio bacteriovorus (strain ATCC 15356 / DSM 50701 / NCIMB 9529 / HD100) TaxID=264462 RepID=Q6MMP9_BDEBA|nr:MFS transporter [Bdellovibrio bacteriovorus]CAE79455.1 multidrug resistance protein [Bdellovibrio bacteriovorus HD100]